MTLRVLVDGREARGEAGATLYACAESVGVYVPTSCFAQGKCRECLVEVELGAELLSPRTPEEEALDARFRLSCRARLEKGGEATVRCHTLRRGALRIEEGDYGLEQELDLCPGVESGERGVVRDGEVIDEVKGKLLGLAVDVGTTTVVLRLFDLETGVALASSAFENPQRFGGTDVMARIRFDGEHPGRLLQRTLLGYLARAIEELPGDSRRIFEVVVAGNTAMRDLFFGLDVRGVGEAPYRSLTEVELLAGRRASTALFGNPRKLRLPVHPEARIVGLPLVASHVGADAAAAMLATGIGTTDGVRVLMDIGTNTEVIAGNRARLVAASCPAGPAFEGGAIRNGMPALDGAIERVALRSDGSVESRVIGDVAPLGVCGSGLVDCLGELVRTGRMNERGRIDEEEEVHELVLDREADLRFTEFDVNELAQAKGANAAGLACVFELLGVRAGDIEVFYLAGGFARHLDLDASRRIGLVPDLPDERFRRVGNAALLGASQALLSTRKRAELEQRIARVEHVRLETHPSFFDHFVEGCLFQPFRP